jgi:hypothetical protein
MDGHSAGITKNGSMTSSTGSRRVNGIAKIGNNNDV